MLEIHNKDKKKRVFTTFCKDKKCKLQKIIFITTTQQNKLRKIILPLKTLNYTEHA